MVLKSRIIEMNDFDTLKILVIFISDTSANQCLLIVTQCLTRTGDNIQSMSFGF